MYYYWLFAQFALFALQFTGAKPAPFPTAKIYMRPLASGANKRMINREV